MAIELYSWATPNGHKVHILLEELGVDYRVHPIDIGNGDQFDPDFLKISPNNRIPAIVDPEGPGGKPLALMESGAILLYLAEKHGRFLPAEGRERYLTLQWLMWQMGGLGPMLGQAHHFLQYAPEKIDYAMKRYANEANRLYGVLDKRLGESRYLAGDDYSIADMAAWPWTRYPERQEVRREDYPNFQRWFEEIAARPAVVRGVEVLVGLKKEGFDDKAKEMLFGATQFQRR
ncbi:MAG: glutathione S-transferase N-terminal domain-containing protein [Tistlia sp.]|uniref:glutathione S-transferase N-terminal domain-containing protein n=1 Tax=Tistlia sp. TaxID=3057121 RepID=UPI0034A19062